LNVGVAVGAGVDPLGVTVPLGVIAAALFTAFVGVGVGVAAGGAALDIPLIIAEAAAGSTVLVNESVGPVPLVFPLMTN